MSEYAEKTLWGIPVVVTDAVPPGVVITGPIPTWEDAHRYGSLEKAIEARAREYGKITGLDDANETRMNRNAQPYANLTGTMRVNEAGRVVLITDKPARDPLDVEIEIIKRTLHNALDRLEKLRKRQRA